MQDYLSLEGPVVLRRAQAVGLYPDGMAELVYYSLPDNMSGQASDWLRENRLVLKDAKVRFDTLSGTWRTIQISEEKGADYGISRPFVLVQRLGKGFYREVAWASARVIQGDQSTGNEIQPDNVAEGRSALIRRLVTIEFPHIDPETVDQIKTALSVTSFTDAVVGKEKLDGVWFQMGVIPEREEDGSYSIKLTIGQPVFTVRGYRSNADWEDEDRFYVSNVPQQRAQAVMDAWRLLVDGTDRIGASAVTSGHSPDRKTVDIILSVGVFLASDPSDDGGQIIGKAEDTFKSTLLTRNVNQLEPGADPTEAVGIIEDVRNTEVQPGLFQVDVTRESAKRAELNEYVTRRLFNGRILSERRAEHLANLTEEWTSTPAVPTVGEGVVVNRRLNQYNSGYSVERQEIDTDVVYIPSLDAGAMVPYTFSTRDGTGYIQEAYAIKPSGLQAVLDLFAAAVTTSHQVSPRLRFDEASGVYDVELTAYPRTAGSGSDQFYGSGDWITEERKEHTDWSQADGSGNPQTWYRVIKFKTTVKFHTTFSAAATACNLSEVPTEPVPRGRRWMSRKIEFTSHGPWIDYVPLV